MVSKAADKSRRQRHGTFCECRVEQFQWSGVYSMLTGEDLEDD